MAAGLVERRPEWTDLPSASSIAAEPYIAVVDRVDSKVRIEVLYEPYWHCDLAIEGPTSISATAKLDVTGKTLMEVELTAGQVDAIWHVRAVLSPPRGSEANAKSSQLIVLQPPHSSAAGSPSIR